MEMLNFREPKFKVAIARERSGEGNKSSPWRKGFPLSQNFQQISEVLHWIKMHNEKALKQIKRLASHQVELLSLTRTMN